MTVELDTSPEAVEKAKKDQKKKEEKAISEMTPEAQSEVKVAEAAKNCMAELDAVSAKFGFKSKVEAHIILVKDYSSKKGK